MGISPFIELGYKPERDIRISLGYNFIHYHDGQIPELDYSASSLYLKTTGKFGCW
ncbi:MAG: hypothetical protein AB1630_05745 [bacterium]